ncbi:hypothetical protein M9Y10_029821 [Tritrichomonas musculus]|uniref:SCP domain-containing protein n=1 Tax=Tritrichomonas musculus TaxID=1915356 RepID=A0ABR2KN42_9EUKA
MSGNVSTERKTNTVSKNGKTIKTETTIETTVDPTGKVTKKTTVIETTSTPDGSTSTSTKTTVETSRQNPEGKGYVTESDKKRLKKEKKKEEKEAKKEAKKREKRDKLAAASLDKDDKEFLRLTNEYRKKFGKEPLKLVESMCTIEKEHNDLMLSGKRGLGHEGFHDRAKAIPNATATAENVCYCTNQKDYMSVLFGSLVNDPPHRENILGPYNSIGVSVGKNEKGQWFASQIFAYIE